MSDWIQAARPATLWAGVAPVLVASALAAYESAFRWDAFVAALIGSVLIQVGVNYANDLADAARGADTADRIGPRRAVATGTISARTMRNAMIAVFVAAGGVGVYLIAIAGWPVAVIGVVSIVAALGYTNGPVPYGYRGLGEVFVFVFFGLVATVGTRFVHDRTVTASSWWLAIVMGFLVTAILVANNIRDIDTDAATGKRTLAVVLGRRRTRAFFVGLIVAAYVALIAGLIGPLPAWAGLGLATIPLAVAPTRTVLTRTDGPGLITALAGTARLQLAVAATVSLGLLLA
ncbi:MAG: 1,4-dihydroxy-2-naphthoate polyprenyltransferase [Acidimicrobiia bacterium]|nr:1,4-dihydroxy-2-naphthoate polyprenyltransferase [Acidimicrobiia bacterium]NNK92143.1 1,4-dihydroxy-2-naphthoate polyprenyltransferase [Acidimicrobiia bacterium]